MSQRPVVFFDIGETLAAAAFNNGQLHLAVYDYIPAVIDQLVEDKGAILGIISNSHQGHESPEERRTLTADTLRALEEAGLLPRFNRDLVILSSEIGLRKSTRFPFELAAGRAARVAGALPRHCIFVGENRKERLWAKDAGMRPAPHPLVASAVVNGRILQYLLVDVPDEASRARLAAQTLLLSLAPLHDSLEDGVVLMVGTKEAAVALRDAGFSVRISPTHADAALSDAFLFREATASSFAGDLADLSLPAEIAMLSDGQVIGLAPDQSVDDYHIGRLHGHTLKLAPNPYLLDAVAEGGPAAFAEAESAEVPLAHLTEVVQRIVPETIQKYVDKYSGRNPNEAFVTRNRHIRSAAMSALIDELVADFEAIGQGRLRVSKHRFFFEDSLELYNVVAELPGRTDEIVLITAHLDSTARGSFGASYDPMVHDAPGADDDASGLAGVICAAQVFCSLYRTEAPERTVRFVLFNAEEQGLVGSQHYAHEQRAIGADIAAVFQMDMIGYNVQAPASWEVHAGHSREGIRNRSLVLAEAVRGAAVRLEAMGTLVVELPQVFPERSPDGKWLPDPASGRSDHASFQDRGYPACVASGDFFNSHGQSAEANPNYHMVTDTHVSFPYATDLTRCIVIAALGYVGPALATGPSPTFAAASDDAGSIALMGTVRLDVDGTPLSGASVTAFLDSTPVGETVADEAGQFELSVPAGDGGLSFVFRDRHGRPRFSTHGMPMRPSHDMQITVEVPEVVEVGYAALEATVPLGGLEIPQGLVASTNRNAVLDTLKNLVQGKSLTQDLTENVAAAAALEEGSRGPSAKQALCQTELIASLRDLALRLSPGREAETHAEIDAILFGTADAFAQRVYNTQNFSIRYETSGVAAVDSDTSAQDVLDPGMDPPVVLATLSDEPFDGTPTYVRRVAFWLERSLGFYTSAPFSMRNPAAEGRIRVVINATPFGGATPSGFTINNNLHPDLICAVAVHELFHMVQFEYNLTGGPWRSGLMEGGATFAEDTVADRMNRYLDESGSNFNGDGFLVLPNRRMFDSDMRYKTCLFWRYVAEQRSRLTSEPVIGVDTYRRILELCASEGCQTAVVSRAVAALPWGTSLFEYQYIDDEKEYLESSETTLGNFALACYLKDHEVDDRRFTFLEAREPIYIDEIVPGAPQSDTLVPVKVQDTKTVRANAAAAFSGTVAALGSVYYEIDVENGVENVALAYASSSAGSGTQCQVVIITADGKVKDIIRTDRDRFHKHIVCGLEDGRVARLVAVVTGGSSDDTYQISVAPGVPASDVMITRWNTEIGREYHMDPRGGAWTWTSPDIQVRPTDRDADYDLRICVRNKGNSRARSVSLSPEYRPMDDSRWRPVAGPTGDPVNAPAADLDVGTEHTFMFHWRPEGVAAGGEYLIRAKVRSPDDMNRDNVTAVTRWSSDRLV